jgi:uncharacterized cupin superfamily protein
MTRHLDASAYPLEPDGPSTPAGATSAAAVGMLGDVEVGLWEITPGTVTDVEEDEVFVVLSGSGTVRFADGEEIRLAPGSLVRLHAGEETTWEIHETLRKVYVVAAPVPTNRSRETSP